MFDNDNYLYVVFGLLALFITGHIIVQKRESIKLTLQYRLVCYGIVMFILLLQLPSIPSLALLGNHGKITTVANDEKLLLYLERCNDAMYEMKQVIHYIIFITVFWLVYIISAIIKHFALEKTKE